MCESRLNWVLSDLQPRPGLVEDREIAADDNNIFSTRLAIQISIYSLKNALFLLFTHECKIEFIFIYFTYELIYKLSKDY